MTANVPHRAACKIEKLDETVINRIAAGEVIQRPANALKELLENCLDAGSKNISVSVHQGGLKLLLIQDDGCGIRKDDLEIVCERFTTSKLSKFEDLLSIGTYGFRGEALASISHVAHLTITTKTADSAVGYKASYEDSKLKGPPKACAALQGTLIRVEDLFYNVATRRKALKNPSEEFRRVFDVVVKYAVHNHKVGFTLKSEGSNHIDVRTSPNSTAQDNIRIIYGTQVSKHLMPTSYNDDVLKFKLTGCVTNATYSEKKLNFLLFINHRLVDSTALRKIIEQIYSIYLPKGSHPFVYLSLELNPAQVDVNVHPTKHEVHFLHEEAVLDKVRDALSALLTGSNESRAVYTQSKLPQNFTLASIMAGDDSCPPKDVQEAKALYPQETIRTDPREQKIDKFLKEQPASSGNGPKNDVRLTSIFSLRDNIKNAAKDVLVKMIRNTVFVGVVSPSKILLQHDTRLYLCNLTNLAYHLFYQIILTEFANFGIIKFSTSIAITELAMLYLDGVDSADTGWADYKGSKDDLAQQMKKLLVTKRLMLEHYFSIEITEDGNLGSVPLLLDQHTPDMALLPDFVVRVCTEVDWEFEKPCLDGISQQLAHMYSHVPTVEGEDGKDWRWQIEHVIMPAVKSTLMVPGQCANDGTFLQIANLPDLYRVFERC